MNKINWTKLDFIALVLIPVQFLVSWVLVVMQVPHTQNIVSIVIFAIGLLSVCILSKIYGTVLKNDWVNYRKKIWLKILISIVGAGCIIAILQGVRLLMAPFMPVALSSGVSESDAISAPFAITLIAAVMPLINAYQEEIIFRHVLFYKLRGAWYVSAFFFFASAFLFGIVHLNNFDGNFIRTIPYMVIAMCFNLVYLFTKNIWYSIGIHLAFNFLMAFVPALFMLVMQRLII
ncbi:MAG: CPBP family intramembrane metalloprotease [Oscillospiraceae bacterium]|nr:CPBP family intramembrane metalloprotease [Oscillospiraceae bacterium]